MGMKRGCRESVCELHLSPETLLSPKMLILGQDRPRSGLTEQPAGQPRPALILPRASLRPSQCPAPPGQQQHPAFLLPFPYILLFFVPSAVPGAAPSGRQSAAAGRKGQGPLPPCLGPGRRMAA